MPPASKPLSSGWAVGLVLVLLAGTGLRLVWVEDMEYKGDERWFFGQSQPGLRDPGFPWIGLPSSAGMPNPGTVGWPFVGLAWLTGATEPTQLARAVQCLNVLALFGLVAFALFVVPREEREPWLWAAALLAVNPIAVLMHRKLWNVSVLLLAMLPVLVGWWYRRRWWGAFLWGLASLVVTLIHPPGLFFAVGTALWAGLFDRKNVAWSGWLLGCVLGALPLLPWVMYLNEHRAEFPSVRRHLGRLFSPAFYKFWASEPAGFSLQYSLDRDFWQFVRGPHLFGSPTYLVAGLHLAALALLVSVLLGWLHWFRNSSASLGALFVGGESQTAFTQAAYLWSGGLLVTVTLLPVHRHYMQLVVPLMFLWLARLALRNELPLPWVGTRGRGLLAGLVAVQLAITTSFLGYIHTHDGPVRGDYGLPYRQQITVEARADTREGPR